MTTSRARIHWLDALTAAVALLAVVAGVVGYRALQGSHPKVDALEPATIRPAAATRVRLRGRDLRPFVQAFLVKANAPFVLHDPSTGYQQADFYLLNPREAEIDAPALMSGDYDLYLYDQGQRVAMRSAALRVEPEARTPLVMDVTVQFLVPPETAPLVHVGDRDRREARPGSDGSSAEVRAITPRSALARSVELAPLQPQRFAGPETLSRVLAVTLTVPVTRGETGAWLYRGVAVRAGEDFTLQTGRYIVSGTTLDVEPPK